MRTLFIYFYLLNRLSIDGHVEADDDVKICGLCK